MTRAFAPAVGFASAIGGGARTIDRVAAAAAVACVCAWTYHVVLAENASDAAKVEAETNAPAEGPAVLPTGGYVLSGYGGAPYTHPSDVKISNPGSTDLTARDIVWEGKPFKSPIYYGVRVTRWATASPFGGMVDFTHSKAISQRDQRIELTGTRDGERLPDRARLGDVFHNLEFSHGHNTLILNGLMRLADIVPRLAPYIGGGLGVAIPHTEVRYRDNGPRTYEYQYVGPAAQCLIGLEFRLPAISLFLEYKFTIAHYEAPLTNRSGSWFPQDFVRQAVGYWRGEKPSGGYLSTTLASHQVISGLGIRFARPPSAPPRR